MKSSSLAPLSFLIVDDNANMVMIVKLILKSFGAVTLHEASDVAQAFQIARRHSIDVAIVDYHLGFMDGVAFVRLMRTANDSPTPFLPIIMLSAYSEESRVIAARDAGATEFCVKPVTAAELLRKINDVIDKPRHFVRTETFFGPCRRRHRAEVYEGPERRSDGTGQAAQTIAQAQGAAA